MGNDLTLLQGAPAVHVGDSVVINLKEEIVRRMQIRHGGWHPAMKRYLCKKGTVTKIDPDGDIVINFQEIRGLTFNPNVVAKVLRVGDIVKITDDREKAKFLLNNHGGWVSNMERCLGGMAKVVHVYDTYDVKVQTDCGNWCFNPLLCTVIKKSSDEDTASKLLTEFVEEISQIFNIVSADSTARTINTTMGLHRSVHGNDHRRMMELLEKGININETDTDGDTALHLAVMKNNLNIVKLLLKKGAKADILNKKKLAPIHIAVCASFTQCLKELLEKSINVEDNDGDTPLGYAIMKRDREIINILLHHPYINLTKRNCEGFSCFHIAVKIGDTETVKAIVQRKPDIVNIQKDDGFSALHLAALNNNFEVAKVLVRQANAKLSTEANGGLTPLMLAAYKNDFDMVKLLVDAGADIDAKNENNDTSLHIVIKSTNSLENTFTGGKINVITYLVENGASLTIQNKEGKTPLELIADASLKTDLKKKADGRKKFQEEKPCLICSERKSLVKYQPCGHLKICAACFIKNKQIKTCIECEERISGRNPDTDVIPRKNLEEEKPCQICSEKQILMKFQPCGHFKICAACFIKNKQIKKCTECQEEISGRNTDSECISKQNLKQEKPCQICSEEKTLMKFQPCGHFKICTTCFIKNDHLKKCMECQVEISGRILETTVISRQVMQPEVPSGRITEEKVIPQQIWQQELPRGEIPEDKGEDQNEICCVRCGKTTAEMLPLQCGHAYCSNCKYWGKCITC